MKTRLLVILAMLTTILFIGQVALAGIPNIEIVSLLIIVYTLLLGKYVFYTIYGFAILEALVYGFGVWWFMYLYVWSILAIVTLLLRRNKSTFFWAVVSGFFGLGFGFLCSIPYLFMGGIGGFLSFFLSGIPFDILHAIGNIVVTIILFKPVYYILQRLLKSIE